jgi:hypothetical protein
VVDDEHVVDPDEGVARICYPWHISYRLQIFTAGADAQLQRR